jgi:hypothetical protein
MDMTRRGVMGAIFGAAMTAGHMTKLGDVVPPLIPGVAPNSPGVPPGNSQVIRARQVIISGASNSFLLAYLFKPGAALLVASINPGNPFFDQFGNQVLQGIASYQPEGTTAIAIDNGSAINFYSGTYQDWTPEMSIAAYTSVNSLEITAPGGFYVNGTRLA